MFEPLFGTNKPVVGVIHLLPLPGSHRYDGQMEPIFMRAEQEAAALTTGGVDGIIIENFFDAPFRKSRVDTATACALALVAQKVRAITHLPIGINVLRNDALTAVAVAATVGAQFIRVNVYTGAMLTDQGIIEGQAAEILEYRRLLGSETGIKVFADVMVKHAVSLSPFLDIRQVARDCMERGMADALIVTGQATGNEPDLQDLNAVREALPDAPLLVGSGSSRDNIAQLLGVADGVIVGSSLKRQGKVQNPVDVERVRSFVSAARKAAANVSG